MKRKESLALQGNVTMYAKERTPGSIQRATEPTNPPGTGGCTDPDGGIYYHPKNDVYPSVIR